MTMEFKTEREWRQAAFNLAFRGLRYQGFERSAVRRDYVGTTCLYRKSGEASGRVCCAVGWLIPDDKFDADYNSARVECAEGMIMDALQPITVERLSFLSSLQRAHDSGDTPNTMERNLRDFATKHRLRIPDEG